MKKLLIPIILLLVGTGSGVGAAFLLKSDEAPHAEAADHTCGPTTETVAEPAKYTEPDPDAVTQAEYAKLNNQFVVPVVTEGRITSMVVLSLSVEVPTGGKDIIFEAEPKLRDAFLQVMFEHANIGGFSGNFTSPTNMRALRNELRVAAQRTVGGNARDVLILDIVRQDS